MSVIIHMKIPGAIVAASDCRITGNEDMYITGKIQENDAKEKKVIFDKPEKIKPELGPTEQLKADEVRIPFGHYDFVNSDTEQKTFLLTNKDNNSFAISYCGQANLNGYPTSFKIKTALQRMKEVSSAQEIAERFSTFWQDENIIVKPSLLVSGYSNGKASVMELQNDGKTIKEFHEDADSFGITYHGEKEVINKLLELGGYHYSLFRLQDAIDFCDLMIKTTARLQAFQSKQQTVSEKYDLLVITPERAKWIRRDTIDIE